LNLQRGREKRNGSEAFILMYISGNKTRCPNVLLTSLNGFLHAVGEEEYDDEVQGKMRGQEWRSQGAGL